MGDALRDTYNEQKLGLTFSNIACPKIAPSTIGYLETAVLVMLGEVAVTQYLDQATGTGI